MKNLMKGNYLINKKIDNKNAWFVINCILIVIFALLILCIGYKQKQQFGPQLAKISEDNPEQVSQPSYTVTINADGIYLHRPPSGDVASRTYSKTFELGTPTTIAYASNSNDDYTGDGFYGDSTVNEACWLKRTRVFSWEHII